MGWNIGSQGYNDCYKARLYERKLDYSLPPGDKPSPSLLQIRVNPSFNPLSAVKDLEVEITQNHTMILQVAIYG